MIGGGLICSIKSWCGVEIDRRTKDKQWSWRSLLQREERNTVFILQACSVHTATRPERITCECWCVQYTYVRVFIWHRVMIVCLLLRVCVCMCVCVRLSITPVHVHVCVILQDPKTKPSASTKSQTWKQSSTSVQHQHVSSFVDSWVHKASLTPEACWMTSTLLPVFKASNKLAYVTMSKNF